MSTAAPAAETDVTTPASVRNRTDLMALSLRDQRGDPDKTMGPDPAFANRGTRRRCNESLVLRNPRSVEMRGISDTGRPAPRSGAPAPRSSPAPGAAISAP